MYQISSYLSQLPNLTYPLYRLLLSKNIGKTTLKVCGVALVIFCLVDSLSAFPANFDQALVSNNGSISATIITGSSCNGTPWLEIKSDFPINPNWEEFLKFIQDVISSFHSLTKEHNQSCGVNMTAPDACRFSCSTGFRLINKWLGQKGNNRDALISAIFGCEKTIVLVICGPINSGADFFTRMVELFYTFITASNKR